MLIDVRWIVLVVLMLVVAVAVGLYPVLVAPFTLAITLAGVLYLLMRLDR